MTPNKLAKVLKDNMENFSEDDKISIAEALMLQSFVQGPN
jgi:hypothetical protein